VADLLAHPDSVVSAEVLMRRKGGRTFLARISSSLVELRGERCNLTLARDITEQRRAEEALRMSSQRLELAIASGRLGIWDWDLVEDTEVWNERMFELYGLEPGSITPSDEFWSNRVVHPDDRVAVKAAFQAALEGDQRYELAFRALQPDGSVRHIQTHGLVLRNDEGRPVRIIGINRDRTLELEAEAEHLRLQAELQHAEKLESIGSLAGGVAHDMNNVLAAILGMASAMQQTCPAEDARFKPLDTIIRACTRGRDVVRSLLYFARRDLESVGPIDLNIVAREVVHLLTYTTLRRIGIETDLAEPLPLIEGDGTALSHALINLCVNAVDAMPEGGTLWLRTGRTPGGNVELSLRDTGTGMTPDVMRRAIEPFFTTKPAGKGTGLGLAMVYGTVKAHRGTFELRSEPGHGTEVILGFPPLAGPPAQPMPAAPPAGVDAPESLRILLVDDDELVRLSVEPMLAALGHQVQVAQSGQEALERFQQGLTADLVILDMNMPGLNGAQTLSRLLEIQPCQRVLMATGYSDDSIAPLLEGRPNVSSLRKPFSLHELRAKLADSPAVSFPRPDRP
jgi:PAS domain S-box-containing protein